MSIWTQVFVSNLIIFVSYVVLNRLLDYSLSNWMKRSKSIFATVNALWVFATLFSAPAWLIYLVIA